MTSAGIHAYLSEASYSHWQALAADNGATLTALLEATGMHLNDPAVRAVFAPIIADAQRLTIERRRRRL